MNRIEKRRTARRVYGPAAIVAILLIVSAACVLVAASSEPSSSPIAAEDEAQVREVLDGYFGLDDLAPAAADLEGRGLSQAAVSDAKLARNATLDAIATAGFAEDQKQIGTMAEFANEYQEVRGVQILKAEHAIRDVAFVAMADGGGAVYRVAVWYGDVRGVWNAKSAEYDHLTKVDSVPVYDVTLVEKDGVWRISAVDQVVLSEDDSAIEYGPSTQHESEPLE